MKKTGIFIIICFAIAMLTIRCFASEETLDISIPENEWEELQDSLPPEVADKLPEGSEDGGEGFADAVAQMSKGEYIVSVVSDALGVSLGNGATLFLVILGVLAVSAVMNTVSRGLENQGLVSAMRFCSSAALMSAMVYTLYDHFSAVEAFFEKLWLMINGMIPITASIWAMGGNVTTAATGSAWFYVMLNVCQTLLASTLIPICCILTVLGICDAISDEIKTGKIMTSIKKIYNFLLGFIMTVLLASLGAQTALSASADTVTARGAKLVSGAFIPIVGGSVGETFRTLAGGVAYLKNIFGIGSIAMIALLTLPPLVSVLMTRFVLLVSGGVADMLGSPTEARLLENLSEVYGTMLAVVSCVSVMFVLGFCIFMRTVVAVA